LENKYREVFEHRLDWRQLVTCESKKGSMRINCRMAAPFHILAWATELRSLWKGDWDIWCRQ
jgi:hypothetical protein